MDTPVRYDEIVDLFTYHPPTEAQKTRYAAIRRDARFLAHCIALRCPESREKSLAITRLREAVMWANAAVALHPGDVERAVEAEYRTQQKPPGLDEELEEERGHGR